MIRRTLAEDVAALRELERAAGMRFIEVGMPEIAAAEPMEAAGLVAYAHAGRSWVAVDDADRPIGYVLVDVIDGCAHVEQISVEPPHQGHGIGRALLEEVTGWARAHHLAALTLTTFSEVPWNRPLYEHLGFRTLGERELSPGLIALRADEAGHGLDPSTRVCMRRDVER